MSAPLVSCTSPASVLVVWARAGAAEKRRTSARQTSRAPKGLRRETFFSMWTYNSAFDGNSLGRPFILRILAGGFRVVREILTSCRENEARTHFFRSL